MDNSIIAISIAINCNINNSIIAYDGVQINCNINNSIIGQILGVALMVQGWHFPSRLRECKGADKREKKKLCRLFQYIIIKYYYNNNRKRFYLISYIKILL